MKKAIEIEMSQESRDMVNNVGRELGAAYFVEDVFEQRMRPSYEKRDPNAGLPEDANGGELVFANVLNSALYGENLVYTLTPEDGYERVILYIHGGAYVHNIAADHAETCDRLATELHAKVYIPMYTLAPQGTYREGYEFMFRVYEDVLLEDREVILMGDSAGGGFALGFAQECAEMNVPLPSKLVLWSPWVDVTMSNPEIVNYEEEDVSLSTYGLIESGKMWAGDSDVNDRKVSPINYEDWSKLPPVMLFVGTAEVFCPDVLLLAEKMAAADLDVTLVKGIGLYHVFPVYPHVPESAKSIELIAEFLKKKLD